MNDAFYIGATGMQAQQINVDTIANNLANVNTIGFKKARLSFSDLVVRESGRVSQNSGIDVEPATGPQLMRLGAGVSISTLARSFDLGDFKKTGFPYDVAIQGDGFFEISMPDGARAFSRGGTLKLNQDRQLTTQAGYPLKPGITIPENAQSFSIASDGKVLASVSGMNGPVEIGQLEVTRFSSPTMLTVSGDNLYRANDASGEPIVGKAGEDGAGTIVQGMLESSNVKLIDEMVNLMVAQRAYEASVKVVQASDEMSGMINNLRK